MEALSPEPLGDRFSAEEVIRRLGLAPLPGEGGFFRETYRSPIRHNNPLDPADRSLATAIYYLLTPESFSALHRLRSDEIYHFYSGHPVELVCISEEGNLQRTILGSCVEDGQMCQFLVPAGVWQGSRLLSGGRWALLGTTMAPGFEFTDREMAMAESCTAWTPEVQSFARQLLAMESAGD